MNDAPRVLVCDDDTQILRALTIVLSDAGYEALSTCSAAEALDRAAVRAPKAALIDLVLPGEDGVELCRRLREWSDMPILLLSGIDEEHEKIRALRAGADDYVTKPFSPGELIARLEAALRRVGPDPQDQRITVDELEIDLAKRTVRNRGHEVRLTPIEYHLLRILAENRGKVMTHRSLLSEVWGAAYEADTPTLRFHITNLRKKIEQPGRREDHIRTELGVGYRLLAEAASPAIRERSADPLTGSSRDPS